MRQIARAALPLGEGVILDPFMGGGSTITAVGYQSICIEHDPEFFAMAKQAIPRFAGPVLKLSQASGAQFNLYYRQHFWMKSTDGSCPTLRQNIPVAANADPGKAVLLRSFLSPYAVMEAVGTARSRPENDQSERSSLAQSISMKVIGTTWTEYACG